jgi:hypothetical protein
MWLAPPPIECEASCGCWDCAAYRRAVMRIALSITLILGFAGGLVLEWEATHSKLAMTESAEVANGP